MVPSPPRLISKLKVSSRFSKVLIVSSELALLEADTLSRNFSITRLCLLCKLLSSISRLSSVCLSVDFAKSDFHSLDIKILIQII